MQRTGGESVGGPDEGEHVKRKFCELLRRRAVRFHTTAGSCPIDSHPEPLRRAARHHRFECSVRWETCQELIIRMTLTAESRPRASREVPRASVTYFGLIDQLPSEMTWTSAGRTMGTVPL